jgi:nucleoside-triphosphate--adenylate kinase
MGREKDDGKLADLYIQHGKLVPNDLVTRLTLKEIEGKNRWLLDGFPRNLSQAQALHEHVPFEAVLWLNVPEEEIVNRIKGRWIHLKSGRVYHTDYKPPKVPGIDDLTGEPLTQRPDDREEAVRQRLQQYDQLTRPLIDFFESVFFIQFLSF